jgi:hypothetical protein
MGLTPNTRDELDYELKPHGNGTREEWRLNGALHSVNDEPAVVIDNGTELMWYTHGQRHRNNGPAWVKGERGSFLWYKTGELHRTDGPAIVTLNAQQWYQHGKMHNTEGPARIERRSGKIIMQWWINGVEYKTIDDWAEAGQIDDQLFVMTKLKYLSNLSESG